MQKIKDIPQHLEGMTDFAKGVYKLPFGKYLLVILLWLSLPFAAIYTIVSSVFANFAVGVSEWVSITKLILKKD